MPVNRLHHDYTFVNELLNIDNIIHKIYNLINILGTF